ncbi:MAG: hypothetical protein HXY49_12505 [Ignavibacteriaceae bacterium]|nr:hypothetical protein [Ignavibacteriaceae bacterium]
MKSSKLVLFLLFLFSIETSAQFSIEAFIDEPLDKNFKEAKIQLADKKIEEKPAMNFVGISYYEWFDPFSLKISYLFDDEGKQKGKALRNGKENEDDAMKLFEIFKKQLIKKFGSNISENNMMGMTMLQWKGVEKYTVMLSRKDSHTMLMVLVK